jgi:NAD(P)H-dependent flavin oxidoreductase YrpB (nitropropane dioxygenase family)
MLTTKFTEAFALDHPVVQGGTRWGATTVIKRVLAKSAQRRRQQRELRAWLQITANPIR